MSPRWNRAAEALTEWRMMSLFRSHRHSWRQAAKRLPRYPGLLLEMGSEDAKNFVNLAYDKFYSMTKKAGVKLLFDPEAAAANPELNRFMGFEAQNTSSKRSYVALLRGQAQASQLSNRPDLAFAAPAVAAGDATDALAVAGRWAGPHCPDDYLRTLSQMNPNRLLSFDTIKDINRTLYGGPVPPDRFVYHMAAVSYPSTVGGRHLLRTAVLQPRFHAPDAGSTDWEHWSTFYLAAIATSQPFTDGNKRTARAVYAALMLHGGCPFRAPDPASLSLLMRMEG
ncbi:MAG TPA: Fic family protein [Planctomycetaceae bacterium]|nr:Fic family protein [Planctomycetaceae bacterium]